MPWRLGTQYELCECFECHDQGCHGHPWIVYDMMAKWLCKIDGHELGQQRGEIVACKRRCGYVWAEPVLPRAILIKG